MKFVIAYTNHQYVVCSYDDDGHGRTICFTSIDGILKNPKYTTTVYEDELTRLIARLIKKDYNNGLGSIGAYEVENYTTIKRIS